MSEQSGKWDEQIGTLLTHCYGDVQANAEFKSSLLAELRRKTAEKRSAEAGTDTADDANWGRLLNDAYVPCEPNQYFKATLFSQLKARQAQLAHPERTEAEEAAIQTILTTSYHPVTPRREFQTRLLENLKERQRSNTTIRVRTRRRTFFMSSLAGMAAAAAVLLVVGITPASVEPHGSGNARTETLVADAGIPNLTVPQSPYIPEPVSEYVPETRFVSYAPDAPSFNYRVAEAFAEDPLPHGALGLKNMEVNTGGGWTPMGMTELAQVRPGVQFRSRSDGAGHLGFSDESMISMGPDTIIEATGEGFAVRQGVALISVPETASGRFRLHFPERDIAVEPGTQLALLVENQDSFAEGGAPAPLVMVVEDQETAGGLALTRGRNGFGPLFARYIYSLDNFVTPNLPGRPLCEVECEDLEKMFRTQTVNPAELNVSPYRLASFGGAAYRPRMNPEGFTKRGEKWVADTFKETEAHELFKIRYLSDDYFGLANTRRDLARGLALGPEVIVDAGNGTFYEIYK